MYEAFYGLAEKPFNLTPDPDFLYMSSNHKKAMTYLKYGIESKEGFVQLSGEIGSGKTTLLRGLLRGLDRDIRAAYVVNPRGTFRQILRTILDQLDVVPFRLDYSKERLLNKFQDFLRSQEALNHPVVLIFDEAQNLDVSTLEELRMLSNYETDKRKLVQIILVGQPELREKLARPELRQLSERIAVKAHLGPLPAEETQAYIQHRLQVAGSDGRLRFDPGAFGAIQEYSQGIPRRVNVLCNNILLAGFVEETKHFTQDFVRRVVHEMEADAGSSTDAAAPAAGPSGAAAPAPLEGAVAAASGSRGRWRARLLWAIVLLGSIAIAGGIAVLLFPEKFQLLKDKLL
jgi:putative secretion ATPase (PEP-CTERM system associated)